MKKISIKELRKLGRMYWNILDGIYLGETVIEGERLDGSTGFKGSAYDDFIKFVEDSLEDK